MDSVQASLQYFFFATLITTRLSRPAFTSPTSTGRHDVTQLVSGGNHTVAVTKQGDVFSWGNNQFGQLGQACRTPDQPEKEEDVPAWKKKKARFLWPEKVAYEAGKKFVAIGTGDDSR